MIATLSFDDGGPADVAVIELLRRRGIPGTFYLVASYLNSSIYGRDDFKAIYSDVEVGSHTCSHPHLSMLDRNETRYEVVRAKERIELATGHHVTLFAHPYGSYTGHTAGILESAGYRYARAIQRNPMDRWAMPIDCMLVSSEEQLFDQHIQARKPIHVLCHSWAILQQQLSPLLERWITRLREAGYTFQPNSTFFRCHLQGTVR